MKVSELKPNFSVFGNKGNVWTNTAHIYQSGKGNLCGTAALSFNHAQDAEVIGCKSCLEKYNQINKA